MKKSRSNSQYYKKVLLLSLVWICVFVVVTVCFVRRALTIEPTSAAENILAAGQQLNSKAETIKTTPHSTSIPSPAPSPTSTPTPQPSKEKTPVIENKIIPTDSKAPSSPQSNDDNWQLKLVNSNHLLAADFIPPLSTLANGLKFDSRAISHLNDLLAAAKKQGLSPVVASAYRPFDKQERLFEKQLQQEMASGLDREQALLEAKAYVAYPGSSEHQLGLAADIVDANYQQLDEKQANTEVAKWLKENCHKYGFILRYPVDKKSLTGINFEPWHYRYVGVEAATKIKEQGVVLEEYLGK